MHIEQALDERAGFFADGDQVYLLLPTMKPETFLEGLAAPAVCGAALYGTCGLMLGREPWPLPIHMLHCSSNHVLADLTEFELEEAFAENWEPWE